MLVSFLFALGLAIYTFVRWQQASMAVTESNISMTPHRFCYASTSSRRLAVAIGYCLLVLIVVGGSAYLLSQMVWTFWIAETNIHDGWRIVVVGLAVILISAVFRLPGLRTLVGRLRQIILRHLFFPVLPSEHEETIIQRLLHESQAVRQQNAPLLDWDGEEPVVLSDSSLTEACRRQAEQLSAVHAKLATCVGNKGRWIYAMWYRQEWQLIDNLYRALMAQLQRQPHCRDLALLGKLQVCHYYCYHLLVRYVFSTCLTRKRCERKFAHLGFKVRLS